MPSLRSASERGTRVHESAHPTSWPKDSDGWLTTRQVADLMGVSQCQAGYYAERRHIPAIRNERGHWLLDEAAVHAYAQDRARWVSAATVAAEAGVSSGTVSRAALQGEIVRRGAPTRAVPSLDRDSAAEYVARVKAERAARHARREEQQWLRDHLEPPGEHTDWIRVTEASHLLGISTGGLSAKAAAGRIPAVKHRGRWWFRRAHVEQTARAREAMAQREVHARRRSADASVS